MKCIFKMTNVINNLIYVAKTSRNLKKYTTSGSGRNYLIDRKKYGVNNFKRKILEILPNATDAELYERETFWINKLKASDPLIGYNKRINGKGSICGYRHTKESLIKISNQMKGKNNPFYGKHHTKESIEKITELQKKKIYAYDIGTLGFIKSYDSIQIAEKDNKISHGSISKCAKKNDSGTQSTCGGYLWSYSYNTNGLKFNDIKTHDKNNQLRGKSTCKKVIKYDLDDNIIQIYPSQKLIESDVGLHKNTIRRLLNDLPVEYSKSRYGFYLKRL